MKKYFVITFLIVVTFFSCSNKNVDSRRQSIKYESVSIDEDTIQEKYTIIENNKYTISIDTLLSESFNGWWISPYCIVEDTLYIIRENKYLNRTYNGIALDLFEFQIDKSIVFLTQSKDYWLLGVGYEGFVEEYYIADKETGEIVTSLSKIQIKSILSHDNICLFSDFYSNKDITYGLLDIKSLDTLKIFPKEYIISYFDKRYYFQNREKQVFVYDENFDKINEFENYQYLNYFGCFEGTYFGFEKELVRFFEKNRELIDVHFETSLNEQSYQIFKSKLYIYGWAVDGDSIRLLRYEVSKRNNN